MSRVVVIPGPETVVWWGVNVPVLAGVLGIAGILLGHVMAPVIGAPLPLQRQLAVIAAGILISLSITMVVGQKPLVSLAWSIGIGFSGITIFQTLGTQARAGMRTLGEIVVDKLQGKDEDPAA